MIKRERAGSGKHAGREIVQIGSTLILLAALTGCGGGKGVRDAPQAINQSPHSSGAYDPEVRELEDEPVEPKKQY